MVHSPYILGDVGTEGYIIIIIIIVIIAGDRRALVYLE